MGSFASKSDTTALIHLHSGAVIILVEGDTDEKFLERMFPDMKAEIRFESVGGCTRMADRLKTERAVNPKVYGLLDRDALKRDKKWSALFETDDEAFAVATRIDGLYVLTRWEIENYLLDFIAVQRLFANWGQSASISDADTLLDEMIAAASAELYVTAGWCTAHANGLAEQDCLIAPCMLGVFEQETREIRVRLRLSTNTSLGHCWPPQPNSKPADSMSWRASCVWGKPGRKGVFFPAPGHNSPQSRSKTVNSMVGIRQSC